MLAEMMALTRSAEKAITAVDLRALRLAAMAVPVGLTIGFEVFRATVLDVALAPPASHLLAAGLTVAGVLLFSATMFAMIERAQRRVTHLAQELGQREREARALYEIATNVRASLEVDRVLESVVTHTRQLFDVEIVNICMMDERERRLVLARTSTSVARSPIPVTVASNGHAPVTALDPRDGHAEARPRCPAMRDVGVVWHTMAALRVGNTVVGELCLGSQRPRQFSQRDRDLLTAIANQASIALSNARLYEQAHQTAILEERDRIAREMHDSLAQVLAYLALRLHATRQQLAPESIAACREELVEIAKVADEAFVDVREAILGLRESVTPTTDLTGALAQYLQKFARQSGIVTQLVAPEDVPARFTPAVEVQLVRIVQEALTNVRKHAGARAAWVRVEARDGFTSLTIEDDGRGFDPAHQVAAATQRFGLQTMVERAERVGGTLTIDSAPGRGSRVTVRLPMRSEETRHATH